MEEKWADIDGYNGYQVSNMGNIRSLKSMKMKRQFKMVHSKREL